MKKNNKTTNLPNKGIMFLGGHPNMVKKLRQIYPDWGYVSDEQFQRKSSFKQNVIFYWTGHGSHQLMKYVYSKISNDTKILYVTATNISMLLNEMNSVYEAIAV